MVLKSYKILLVDDEEKFLSSLSERIRLKGHEPLTATSGREAIECARSTKIDLAIVDYRMPEMNGIAIITKIKELQPNLKTLLLTGYGNAKLKEAAEAIDANYFEKDRMLDFWQFIKLLNPDPGMVYSTGAKRSMLFDAQPITDEAFESALQQYLQRQRIVGETSVIQDIKNSIEKVAVLDCPVLIVGETGTGKKLAARNIHMHSPRNNQKFTAVNCVAFNEDLLNHELFGHDIEDTTGVLHRRKGVIEATPHGTLLFEEVGNAPQSLQVKLIRLLEEGTILRIEGSQEIRVDVRVLASTNRQLTEEVESRKFREDLFYALNAFVLRIPPLRERSEDIPLLREGFP